MTNLDSISKSKDISLPTKVCLVKAMVFPVVMYGCVSWTVKKAEHQIFFPVSLSSFSPNYPYLSFFFPAVLLSHGPEQQP